MPEPTETQKQVAQIFTTLTILNSIALKIDEAEFDAVKSTACLIAIEQLNNILISKIAGHQLKKMKEENPEEYSELTKNINIMNIFKQRGD